MRVVVVSELVHLEEVGNLLQARHGPDLWKRQVNASLQGDAPARRELGRSVEGILGELVAPPAPQDPPETAAWEGIWRERKRWFHVPNPDRYQRPQCECERLPLRPAAPLPNEAEGRCPSCGGPQWEVKPLGAGWYRATIDVWPFRRIRGLTIDAQTETENGTEQRYAPLVAVSLDPLLDPLRQDRTPLTGWTYTSQPELPASRGTFVTNILRKYGRPRTDPGGSAAKGTKPAKEKVKFEFSNDVDKRVWVLQPDASQTDGGGGSHPPPA